MGKVTFTQLLCLLAVLVLVGLLIVSQILSGGLMQPYCTRWIISCLMGLALVSMATLTWHRKKYDKIQCHQPFTEGEVIGGKGNYALYVDHIGFFLEKYVAHIGICIFGAGSLFHRVFHVIMSLECIQLCYKYSPMWNISAVGELSRSGGTVEDAHDPRDMIRSEELSRLVMNIMGMFFVMVQIPFLHYFSQFRKMNTLFNARHLLLIVIAADFSVWFYTFLRDADILHDSYPHVVVNKTETPTSKCLEHATVMDQYDEHTLERVLFPLTMEFMLAALEVLIEVWLLLPDEAEDACSETSPLLASGREGHQHPGFQRRATGSSGQAIYIGANTQGNNTQQGALIGAANSLGNVEDIIEDPGNSDQEDVQKFLRSIDSFLYVEVPVNCTIPLEIPSNVTIPSKIHSEWYHKAWVAFISKFNLHTALVFGILEAVLMKFYLLYAAIPPGDPQYFEDHHFEAYYKLPTLIGRFLLAGLPGVIVATHCFLIMRSFKEKRPTTSAYLHGSDVFLILAAVGVIFLTFFELIICICQLVQKDDYGIYIMSFLEAMLYMPQIIISAVILSIGQRRIPDLNHPFYSTLQRSLTFLAMYSFVNWVIDSFLEVEFLNSRTELIEVASWKIFVHLFLPPCIYFRYVSVILFLRVKNLMREVEIKAHLKTL